MPACDTTHDNREAHEPTSQPHLLVVDDNEELLGFLDMLLSLHYRVTALTSPLQAALLSQSQRFDLLVSDIRMPHLSGTELLDRVRSTHLNHEVPVLFISGQVDIHPARSDQAPPPCYLRKPFKSSDLIEAVRLQLSSRPARPY